MSDAEKLAEKLYEWMAEQKYGNESLLHASVCCDFAGASRFKQKLANIISDHMNQWEDIQNNWRGNGNN